MSVVGYGDVLGGRVVSAGCSASGGWSLSAREVDEEGPSWIRCEATKQTRREEGPQMSHRNAPLTPEGRRRLCERVDAGRPICHVAAEAGIARKTLGTWYARWVAEGEAGLVDRSSRPHRSRTRPRPRSRTGSVRCA